MSAAEQPIQADELTVGQGDHLLRLLACRATGRDQAVSLYDAGMDGANLAVLHKLQDLGLVERGIRSRGRREMWLWWLTQRGGVMALQLDTGPAAAAARASYPITEAMRDAGVAAAQRLHCGSVFEEEAAAIFAAMWAARPLAPADDQVEQQIGRAA